MASWLPYNGKREKTPSMSASELFWDTTELQIMLFLRLPTLLNLLDIKYDPLFLFIYIYTSH